VFQIVNKNNRIDIILQAILQVYYNQHSLIPKKGHISLEALNYLRAINALYCYYAYISSRSTSGYSYTPVEPRNVNIGIAYDFGNFFKATK